MADPSLSERTVKELFFSLTSVGYSPMADERQARTGPAASPLDALADPIRLAIVRALADAGGPVGLEPLARAAGVHANTARPHVGALEDAGVLEREATPGGGRGRPAVRYRLAKGFTLPTADFRELAALLLGVALRGARTAERRRAVGREWGRFLAGRPGARPYRDELAGVLARLAVDARVRGRSVKLSSCPCPLVSPDRPDVVCDLLLAAADGALETCGAPVRVGERTHDPVKRRCRARLAAAPA
jgi:predicted ArsR family transcriptional regulator